MLCKTCKYRGNYNSEITCDYSFVTGKTRDCPMGDECTKYEKGKKRIGWHDWKRRERNE